MSLREELGIVLREIRMSQYRTLRDVTTEARISLGYLSEVERGQKEISSEILSTVCAALKVPLWVVLRDVSERLAEREGFALGSPIPDVIPDSVVSSVRVPATV